MRLVLVLALISTLPGTIRAQAKGSTEILTRLFFQDQEACALRWADVVLDAKRQPTLGTVNEVAGAKKLDPQRQNLTQMQLCQGTILIGVRDKEDGTFESGWFLVHTGVEYEEHGDHGHWRYHGKPAIWDARLNAEQGNPAHIYVYGQAFYVANDRLNGYTRVDPAQYRVTRKGAVIPGNPVFYKGGGNHITLAVVADKVGYACWIDGKGPHQGRVDVTRLTPEGGDEPVYSFFTPTGALHGAIANMDKVFLAPADGVCWVEADLHLTRKPEQVQIHHIPLGKDGDKPLRTGAFVNHGPYVLCVTGRDAGSKLVLLDARQPDPQPLVVTVPGAKGTKAVTPAVVQTPWGKSYALIFHDREPEGEGQDTLTILDLDPNRDGDCRDVKIVKNLAVGPSAVQGHYGHHDVAFDGEGRWAFFTNPGEGSIAAMSLKDLEVKAVFQVGGKPTTILAHGAAEGRD